MGNSAGWIAEGGGEHPTLTKELWEEGGRELRCSGLARGHFFGGFCLFIAKFSAVPSEEGCAQPWDAARTFWGVLSVDPRVKPVLVPGSKAAVPQFPHL